VPSPTALIAYATAMHVSARQLDLLVAPPARHPAAGAAGIRQPISNRRCIDKLRPVAWPCRAVPSNS
jgi:hypothetical protein